jgi:Fe-S-cluster containining protein
MTDPPDLAAGTFSSWAVRTLRAQVSDEDAEVPCGGCTACCRSSYFVHIAPDETDTLRRVPRELLFPAPGLPEGHVVLGYDDNGHCPMLVEEGCSIYDDRPRTCRNFDCRVFPAAGIAPDEDGKAFITAQVRRWKFSFPTERDTVQHAAVQAAAAFLQAHPECFPRGSVPNTTQLSILALAIHEIFLRASDASDGVELTTPDFDTVTAALGRCATAP